MKGAEMAQTDESVFKGAQGAESPLMTTKEAAALVGVTTRTITRMCVDGTLPSVKFGESWRINRAKFLTLLGLA